MGVSNYVVGILIALGTTFLSAFGLVLQKRVHGRLSIEREKLLVRNTTSVSSSSTGSSTTRSKEYPKHLRSYHQPLWIIGLLCLATSSLLSLAVFSLLGQAVASATASFTIIWNLLLARLLLHEAFTNVDALVTCFLLAGAVTAVVFGRQGTTIESALSPRTIQNLWTREAVIIFTPLIGIAMIICIWYNYVVREYRKTRTATRRQIRIAEVLLLFLSGCFSGFTGFLSRGFVSLISYAIQDDAGEVFTWWASYMFPLFLIPSLFCQVMCVNTALKMADATEVVPQYQSWIVSLGVIFGYIYYNEGSGKSTGALIGFWIGIILIVIGILLLFLKRKPEPVSLVVAQEINQLLVYNTVPILSTDPPRTVPFDPIRSFHRSQSAPPGTLLQKGTEFSASANVPISTVTQPRHYGRINLNRKSSTVQKYVKLKYYGEENSVSNEEILQSPRPPKHFIGVPGIEDYVPTSIDIQACYPVVPAMASEPIHDYRYYRTLHIVNLCQLQTEKFLLPVNRTRHDKEGSRNGTPTLHPSYAMETKYSQTEITDTVNGGVGNDGTENVVPIVTETLPKTTKRVPQRWYDEAHRSRPPTPKIIPTIITEPASRIDQHTSLPTTRSDKPVVRPHKQRRSISMVVNDLWQMDVRKENGTSSASFTPSVPPVHRLPSDHRRVHTMTDIPVQPLANPWPPLSSPSHRISVPEPLPRAATNSSLSPNTKPIIASSLSVSCIMEPSYVRIPVALTKFVSVSPSLLAAGLRLKAAEEEAAEMFRRQNTLSERLRHLPERFFARIKHSIPHPTIVTVRPKMMKTPTRISVSPPTTSTSSVPSSTACVSGRVTPDRANDNTTLDINK